MLVICLSITANIWERRAIFTTMTVATKLKESIFTTTLAERRCYARLSVSCLIITATGLVEFQWAHYLVLKESRVAFTK